MKGFKDYMTKKKKAGHDALGEPLSQIPEKKGEHFAFCKHCNGKGINPDDAAKLCPICNGSGMVKA
jgi:rubrerythrin